MTIRIYAGDSNSILLARTFEDFCEVETRDVRLHPCRVEDYGYDDGYPGEIRCWLDDDQEFLAALCVHVEVSDLDLPETEDNHWILVDDLLGLSAQHLEHLVTHIVDELRDDYSLIRSLLKIKQGDAGRKIIDAGFAEDACEVPYLWVEYEDLDGHEPSSEDYVPLSDVIAVREPHPTIDLREFRKRGYATKDAGRSKDEEIASQSGDGTISVSIQIAPNLEVRHLRSLRINMEALLLAIKCLAHGIQFDTKEFRKQFGINAEQASG